MTTSYFKFIPQDTSVSPAYAVFDDSSLQATNAAFVEIYKFGVGRISVWRTPVHSGPWDSVDLIGFRPRADILLDIRVSNSADEFVNELQARDAASGRRVQEAS